MTLSAVSKKTKRREKAWRKEFGPSWRKVSKRSTNRQRRARRLWFSQGLKDLKVLDEWAKKVVGGLVGGG